MRSVNESGTNVPAFLSKLSQLVDDPNTNHLISWTPGGRSLIIQNQAMFSREVLPSYYKHNNMASFIRQLNMYGFHKVASTENGSLKCDKDEMEFSHPCFLQDRPNLLQYIKRKITNPKVIPVNSEDLKPELMNKVLSEVKQMKGRQESMDARFSVMKQENETLWREVAVLRQKHIKQQQIVNNLIQFLMSLVQPSRNNSHNPGVKRKYQLMINNAAHNSYEDLNEPNTKHMKLVNNEFLEQEDVADDIDCGPVIHELADHDAMTEENTFDELGNHFMQVEVPATSPASLVSSPISTHHITNTSIPSPTTSSSVNPTSPNNAEVIIDPTPLIRYYNENKQRTATNEKVILPQNSPYPINHNKSTKLSNYILKQNLSKNEVSDSANKSNTSVKNTIQPSYSVPATPILPNDIFAEDDSAVNEDTTILEDDRESAITALQNAAAEYVNSSAPPSNDQDISEQINNVANYLSTLPSRNCSSVLNTSEEVEQKTNSIKSNRENRKNIKVISNEQVTVPANIKTEIVNNNYDNSNDQYLNEQMKNIANYLSSLTSGNYGSVSSISGIEPNINDNKSKWKNKKQTVSNANSQMVPPASIKEEILSDNGNLLPEQNMSLVSVDNNGSRPLTANDVDDHLDSMQNNIESLRELLRSDSYTLDANTLLGLFGQDDPFYGLSFNSEAEVVNKEKEADNATAEQSGQLMWYAPANEGLDFADMDLMDESQDNLSANIPESLLLPPSDESPLATPQLEIGSPSFRQHVA